MLSVHQFNGLGGTTATRESLIEIKNNAIKDGNEEIVFRIDALLQLYPDAEKFEIELDDHVIEPVPESFLHGLDYMQTEDEGEGLGRVSPTEVYDMITAKVVKMIAEANLPGYKKKWKDSQYGSGYTIPFNFVTKKRYRGVNVLMLTELEPLENPFFLTFKQVKDLKGTVKKGAKGFEVVYFTKIYKAEDRPKNLKFASYDKTKVETFRTENKIENDLGVIPMLKYYHVYNGKDIEGIDFKLASFKIGFIDAEKPSIEANKMDIPEAIIKNYPKPQPTLSFGGNRAFYRPATDHVQMPYLADFETVQDYYRTLLHEFSHSTGSADRLKRDFRGKFGSKPYAFEELVAELGAIFLSAESGIIWHNNTNHAAYLKSWNNALTQIKEDNKFIMRASTAAQKVADFVLQFDDNGDPLYFNDLKKLVEKKPVAKAKTAVKKVTKKTVVDPLAKKVTKKPAVKPTPKLDTPQEKSKELGQLLAEYTIISNRISRFKTKKSIAETKTFDQLNERLEKVIQEVSEAIEGKYYEAKEYISEWVSKNGSLFVFDEKKYLEAALQVYGKTKATTTKKTVSKVQKKDEETVLGFKKESFSTPSKPKTAKKQVVKKIAKGQKKTKEQLEKANPKPFAIKPESTATTAAIKAVLTLPKYKGINAQQAQILYKTFKDEEWEDYPGFYLEKPIKTAYEIARMKNETNFHYFFDDKITIWELGFDLVQTIKNRLDSLEKQNNSYALFDGLKVPITGNIEDVFTPEPEKELIQEEPKEIAPVKNKLMQMEFESLTMDEGWENFMQNPAKNMKVAIWGAPKNGKTAGALQMANYLTKFGTVLYNFADQGFNLSTQELWKSSGLASNPKAEPNDANTLAALEKEIATGKHTFVFIDMISDYIRKEKIKPEEFKERFVQKYPKVSFILIFEVTKGGNFKGDQGWTHVVDAMITVEDFLMENRGRYGMGYHIVWEDGLKRYDPKKYEEIKEFLEPEEEISFTEEVERI